MIRRGSLRVYLGAAPGVGKTYAMLDEGHRRAERGTDVVVGFVETHDRPHTAEQLTGLELLPRREVGYRGAVLTEMDLPAVLARHPEVVLVDEMAHTNAPGVEHAKRWQDIEQLLEAGIDVISTVNVQHLESLNDVVEAITGVQQRETVPDGAVRAAEQVELIDMTPEALRRRMAHGNIYKAEKVDAALGNYFRPGNLTALRELALLWLAGSVDEGLRRYREQHGIDSTWETRERVVVALTGGPEGETLIRRGARIVARMSGGDLMAVHVARSDGLAGSSVAFLEKQRLLVESLGGSYHSVAGDRVSEAILDFARANNATQIVIGASRRNPATAALTGPGTGMTITRDSGSIDVHVVTHDYIGKGRRLPHISSALTRRRRALALLIAAVLLAGLTVVAADSRADLSLASDMLLYLLVVVVISLVGGFYPAVVTAVVASLLINFYLVPPIHTLTISQPENILALVIFVLIAALVSRVVDTAARRTVEAARSNAEAATLSTLAGSLLRGEEALPALLQRVRETFAVSGAALLRQTDDAPASSDDRGDGGGDSASGRRGTWQTLASVGEGIPRRPEDADSEVVIADDMVLVLAGRVLPADDQRMLAAFAAQVAVAYRQRHLAEAAAAAEPLAESVRIRTALLNAVSHDLRTPIASAKAAVSSLRGTEIAWSDRDRNELLATADGALDRLTSLVTNLLDLSRVQAGVLTISPTPVDVEDVVNRALEYVGPEANPEVADQRFRVALPPDLPEVRADAGLLERVVANLLDNALRHSPDDQPVIVAAETDNEVVTIRVVDRGSGIAEADRDAVFEPFRRLGDRATSGVGLGLAISRSFVEAMHGTLALDDTPGGGLTAVISLPRVDDDPACAAEVGTDLREGVPGR